MEERVFSSAEVKEALRRFVCVRLDGRESDESAALKRTYGPVVRGNVQNRIVSPTGENLAALPTHYEADRLAAYLGEWADRYPGAGPSSGSRQPTPYLSSPHQALNVSACDSRPLVVVVGASDGPVDLEDRLGVLVSQPRFVGRFHFVRADATDATLMRITGIGANPETGVYFVSPDEFGMSGKATGFVRLDDSPSAFRAAGQAALADYSARYEPRTVVEKFQLHAERGETKWFYTRA